jgi:ankyrin repeat protein
MDKPGDTPFHIATRLVLADFVELLVESGTGVENRSYSSFTPLQVATAYGKLAAIDNLHC